MEKIFNCICLTAFYIFIYSAQPSSAAFPNSEFSIFILFFSVYRLELSIKYFVSIIVTIGFGPTIAGASYIAEWDLNNEVITPKTYSIGTGHSLPVNALKVINDTHLVSGSDDFTHL
jgi:hypothetical protein